MPFGRETFSMGNNIKDISIREVFRDEVETYASLFVDDFVQGDKRRVMGYCRTKKGENNIQEGAMTLKAS